MNNKPLVSGITIFLNAEKFIQEAIDSVFAQTYDNWELLLIDDGSSDRSTAIALHYAQQYPKKVRYLEHEGHQNCGMSATRNKGIRNAKGEYVAFLDADDVWLPHKLQQQVTILEAQPEAAMLYGLSQYWYSWTGKLEDAERDYMPELGIQPNTLVKPPTLLPLFLKGKAAAPCPSDILVRREVAERIGGFEEDFRGMYQPCEDQAFYAKVCLQVPVFVSSECWDRYRLHPDSCCAVAENIGQNHSVWLFYLNWLEKYLSKQGVKDIEVWQAFQSELWPYRHPTLYRLLKPLQHSVQQMKGIVKLTGRRTLPLPVRRWLKARYKIMNIAS